ncbi:MAG: DUF3015 family protein [Bacteriovoracaceae bacterium]
MKIFSLSVLLTLFFSINSYAKDKSSGCGPGWYVFKKNSLVSSSLRATTNGILFPITTLGMTLGTSNCGKHSIVAKEQESLHYATNNFFEIKTEAASGKGEFLTSFATVLGCHPQSKAQFSKMMKKNYSKLFKGNQTDPKRLLKGVYDSIFSDMELQRSCLNIVS